MRIPERRYREQKEVDDIIRKFGYCGTKSLLQYWQNEEILQEFAHATAHLIHGSTEGRFTVTYAPGNLSKEEIESVHYTYMNPQEAMKRYNPKKLKPGFNTLKDGEEIYFINNPGTGLWVKE